MYLATCEGEVLYKRSRWRKGLEEAKIEMGLSQEYSQDDKDYSLLQALLENNRRAIREMSVLGANINMIVRPKSGRTMCSILHASVVLGDYKTVSLLLRLGANPLVRDSHGLSPRDYVLQGKKSGRIATVLKMWAQKRSKAVNDDRLAEKRKKEAVA